MWILIMNEIFCDNCGKELGHEAEEYYLIECMDIDDYHRYRGNPVTMHLCDECRDMFEDMRNFIDDLNDR